LLLDTRLVAEFHGVEPFLLARFIRSKDAALNAAREGLDPILLRRAQERRRIKLGVLVRLSFQSKQEAERLFDVIEREAEAG